MPVTLGLPFFFADRNTEINQRDNESKVRIAREARKENEDKKDIF